MKYNKSQIMKRAHEIRKTSDLGWSDCLRQSWLEASFAVMVGYVPNSQPKRCRTTNLAFNEDMSRQNYGLRKELGYPDEMCWASYKKGA